MKRFHSEAEILVQIDRYKCLIAEINGAAENKDHLADMLKTTSEASRIPDLRKEAEHIRSRAKWMEGRLKTLGDKLSEFRTPQLPVVDNGDPSIPTS